MNDANYVFVVCFVEYAFIGFYIEFSVYDPCYIIAAYILLYHSCSIPPVSYSRLIIPWVFPAWYHLLYIYLLLHAYAHDTVSRHVYDLNLSIHACLSMLATWRLHHHSLGSSVWLLWVFMSRFWSLECVDSPSCWPERRSWSVDPSRPSRALSF